VILGRGDYRHEHGAALCSLANLYQLHAIGLLCQLLPIVRELNVIGELIIIAKVESELRFRTGDGSVLGRGRDCQQKNHKRIE
jgi:hypothetical protein